MPSAATKIRALPTTAVSGQFVVLFRITRSLQSVFANRFPHHRALTSPPFLNRHAEIRRQWPLLKAHVRFGDPTFDSDARRLGRRDPATVRRVEMQCEAPLGQGVAGDG